MSKLRVVVACVIGVFVLAPAALADSSTVLGGYGSNAAKPVIKVQSAKASSTSNQTSSASETAPAATTTGTLPFTGSDLTLFVVGGVLLVGLGIGLRRMKPGDQ